MKTEICTTKDQSARLLQCGVPAESADMYWDNHTIDEPFLETGEADDKRDTPAWSLSALLALLPTSIISPLGNEYRLELSKLRMHNAWEVQWWYNRSRFTTYDKQKKFHKLWDKSPVGACVKAIEWLTSNGYKLNEI